MKYLIALFLIASLGACKTNSNKENEDKPGTSQSDKKADVETDKNLKSNKNDSEIDLYSKEAPITDSKSDEMEPLDGEYVSTNTNAPANCNTLNINYDAPTDLCIDKEGMTILVRYAKIGGQTELYFSSLKSNNTDKEVPFDTFDTTTPIAVITQKSNKTLTLDWKGFSVDGDIVTDYAILGKKNLEGTFKKL